MIVSVCVKESLTNAPVAKCEQNGGKRYGTKRLWERTTRFQY